MAYSPYMNEEELQQQQPQGGQFMPTQAYYPVSQPVNDVTLVNQTNPSRLLEEFQKRMQGEIPNQTGKGLEWRKMFPSLMNDKGIQSILTDISAVVNQGAILSNFEDEDVRKITIEMGNKIVLKLAANYKEYGIDKSNLSTVALASTNLIFAALRRGFNEGERTFIKTAVSEQIIMRPNERMRGQENDDKKWYQFWK